MRKLSCNIPISACVIGCGKAGARFIKAINYLYSTGVPIKLSFVCDSDSRTLSSCGVSGNVAKYADYTQAFLEHPKVDFIFICVNDHAHYEIFSHIKTNLVQYVRILSEKPLTKDLSEALKISELYKNDEVTLNFVERYSPIIDDYTRWRDENGLQPIKANFFWGKYRIHDPRKTMGVLSEISHPIDLALHLMSVRPSEEISLQQVSGYKSDFSPHSPDLIDSVSICLKIRNQLWITGHSSFVWEKRRRSVTVFLKDRQGACKYMAVFNFDDPVWDLDNLKIYDILKVPGRMELVKEFNYGKGDCIQEIFKVNKIYKFILENIANIYEDKKTCNLAYLDQAIYVQSILDLIEREVSGGVAQAIYQSELAHLSIDNRFVNEEINEEASL